MKQDKTACGCYSDMYMSVKSDYNLILEKSWDF